MHSKFNISSYSIYEFIKNLHLLVHQQHLIIFILKLKEKHDSDKEETLITKPHNIDNKDYTDRKYLHYAVYKITDKQLTKSLCRQVTANEGYTKYNTNTKYIVLVWFL